MGRHEVDGAENVYAATNKNIVVVSVCYRKYVAAVDGGSPQANLYRAPEDPFPCGLHDSYDGLLWVSLTE